MEALTLFTDQEVEDMMDGGEAPEHTPESVSDIIGCPYHPLSQVSVRDIEGAKLSMKEHILRQGRFGTEAHILCEQGGKQFCVRTTSAVIIEQLKLVASHFPLKGSFLEVNDKYFTLQ